MTIAEAVNKALIPGGPSWFRRASSVRAITVHREKHGVVFSAGGRDSLLLVLDYDDLTATDWEVFE